VNTTQQYDEILRCDKIEMVAVCTPDSTHYEIAERILESGKHVLISKPMTASVRQAEDLLELAEQRGLRIFIDHTFIYSGAAQKIKSLIDAGEIGDIYYYDSMRVNLGLLQHDVNVLWDLVPHDISIMNFFLNKRPEGVVATGSDHFGDGFEDVAYLSIYYPNNLIAHINANWLLPVKIRQTVIAGDKKMVVWDDNQPSEKVRIYDKGIEVYGSKADVYNQPVQYRSGDIYCPKLDLTEALAVEIDHIVDCLQTGKRALTEGANGVMVVKILEAAQKSIANRGKEVYIAEHEYCQ
jgi:predicted dehydrogenase